MEISNQVIGTAIAAVLMGGASAGGIGLVKNSQLSAANVQVEEKKDLKFASFETLCKDQLVASEARYTQCQESLASCWAAK